LVSCFFRCITHIHTHDTRHLGHGPCVRVRARTSRSPFGTRCEGQTTDSTEYLGSIRKDE
jgi:hypothetical protein